MAAASSRFWFILKVLAGLAALVMVLVAAALFTVFSSSFQESMVRRELTKNGADDIQLEAFHATWDGLTARRIAFKQNGLKIDLSDLTVRYHLRRLLDHVIELPEVTGHNLDLTVEDSPAAKTAPSKSSAQTQSTATTNPFPVQLPYKVILGKLDLSGKVTVHLAQLGSLPIKTGEWHLTGGGLAPGSTGQIRFEFHPQGPALPAVSGGILTLTADLPESATGQIDSTHVSLTAENLPLVWANLAATAKGVQIDDGQLSAKVLATANAHGATVLPGSGLQVTNLKLHALHAKAAISRPQGASFTAELLHPYPVDPAKPLVALDSAAATDWAKVTFGNIPLEAAAPWLPGRQLSGTWVHADGVVRLLPGKEIMFTASTPWQFADLGFSEGGQEYFHGSLTIKPTLLYGPTTQWVRFTDLAVSDTRGYRLQAHGGLVLKGAEDQVNGGITLKATLPFFPGMPEKKGPYGIDLSATAHLLPHGKSTLTKLRASITGNQQEMLASIAAEQPVTVERTPEDEWLVSSPQPLQVKTAAVPLAGIEPVFTARGFQVEGLVPATEFALWFSPRHFRLEPKTPIAVQHFHLVRGGEVLIDRAMVRFTPAVDLQFEHHLLPAFRFNATSTLSVKSGVLAVDGSRVGLFDFETTVSGTEKLAQMQPKNIQGGLWLDLGPLGKTGLFSHARLPAKGEFRLEFGKSVTEPKFVEFQGGLDRVVGRDGKPAPSLEYLGRAQGDFTQRAGGFGVKTIIHPLVTKAVPKPRPTEFHFGFKVDFQKLSVLDISSKLESDFVNADDVMAFERAFTPAVVVPVAAAPAAQKTPANAVAAAVALTGDEPPPWGIVRGHFTLGIKELSYAPYTIKNLGGKLVLSDHDAALQGLSGEILGGKWSADLTSGYQPGHPDAPVMLKAHFALTQIDAAQAVHLKYPNPPAGIDGKLNLDVTVAGEGKTWEELPDVSTGQFVLTATGGHMRLVLPQKDMISNALIVGGLFTFSKELRALGRFVKTLEDLPVNQIRATGTLAKDGKLQMQTISMDSPQLKLNAVGEVKNAKTRDLLGEPLQVNASLAASSDIAIMLDGMNLLEKGDSKGFLKMKQPFTITGSVGQPDLQPLYDLLARAVDNSHGSWGLLMRKVQGMVPKTPPKPAS